MAKKKRVDEYRFRVNVTYAPLNDTSYAAGQIDPLVGWDSGAIERALKAGLIERYSEQEEVAALPVDTDMAGEEDKG